jgi:uncharacterized repeat protein (TIGR02543 family)
MRILNNTLKLAKKYATSLCLVMLAIVLSQSVAAQYTLQDDDVRITDGVIDSCLYNFEQTDIIIPDVLQGQVVKEIADGESYQSGVFAYKGITNLKLPSTLEYIGYYAFRDNALTTLDLSNCVNLEIMSVEAFCRNSLTSINFDGCSKLEYIGNNCFRVNYLSDVNLSGCTGLKIIGTTAFKESGLSSVDITGCTSLEFIDYGAFSGNAGLESFVFPNSLKPGYDLSHWLSSAGDIYDGGEAVTSFGSSFTAIFTLATYTISYDADGGTHSNVLEYTIDDTPLTLEPAQKEEHVFLGWYDNPEFTGEPITTVAEDTYGDLEFWASYKVGGYTITYNADGGTHSNESEYYPESTPITLLDATKEGYNFLGWFDNAEFTGDAVTKIAQGTTGDLEFWAKWELANGVEDIVERVSVFPNPANQMLTISHNSINVKSIRVFNTSGQFVFEIPQTGSVATSIDVADFTVGLYYLMISTTNGEVMTRKFIKN